jgi:hypothetical protein
MQSAAALWWRARFARWPRPLTPTAGYTLLVPVPGDIPVFLDLALAVCRLQDHENRLSTFVIPDVRTPQIESRVAEAATTWPGELRLLDLPHPERELLPRLRNPGKNHGVQIIAGVSAASSSHVVLHDADLFMLQPNVHESQYVKAKSANLSVLGVSKSWDDWYPKHGLTLAATWEMTARTDWLRMFPPYRHMGHDARMFGEQHTFDTTFWAQCQTPPAQIGIVDRSDDLVHFNYVISTYRNFQRSKGPFPDNRFRLLLIRLMIDLFDHGDGVYAVPELSRLAAGLGKSGERVYYVSEDAAAYRDFRPQLTKILDGPWSDPDRRAEAVSDLRPFDEFFDA